MNAASTGHVVHDVYVGKTHIKICDDYCRTKTLEEVDAILKHIASWAREPLLAAEEAKAANQQLSA